MKSLLAIEWLKVRRYRTFWIILILFAVLFPVVNYYVGSGLFGPASSMILGSAGSFSTIWLNTCFYASHFVIFLALLLAMLTTNEFQYRTNRQNVIDGLTREQFLQSKWILALVIAIGSTVLALLVGLMQGIINEASFAFITDGMYNLLWLFLLTVNYLCFGITIGLLLRRAGLAIILILVYYMMAEPILHGLLFYKFKLAAGDLFLPMEVSDQLLPRPALNAMAKNMLPVKTLSPAAYAGGTVAWIVLYYLLGRLRVLRSDL